MRRLRSCLALLVAFAAFVPSFAADLQPPARAMHEVVDHYIDAQLKEQGHVPAPLADDATLLRRLTLDLNGRMPTAAEVRAYLSSTEPDRKVKLVDRLMASPAFGRHLVEELDAMLAPAGSGGRRGNSGSVRTYLTQALKANRSWDRIYRDLILADEKEPIQKGSVAFLKSRVRDLDRLTTDVSVLFFGVNISCAQCHDHPNVHDWKQDHYYGLKSFFARSYEAGPFLGERDTGVVTFKTTKNVSKTAKMMFLTGKVIDAPGMVADPKGGKKGGRPPADKKGGKTATPPPPPKFSARAALADLALQPEQRSFFAKSIVNRTWHRLFGLGLVTPVDQMHSENPPSHPELLDWLARDTAENGYDLRRLIRGLVLSNAYARSSRYEGDRVPPHRSFGVARLRALTPAQMGTSLRLATIAPDQFPATLKADELDRKVEGQESAGRGIASLLEQPRDDFQISVTEALLFSNSDRIQKELLTDGKDRLVGVLKDMKDADKAAEIAIENVLSRKATAEEKQAIVAYVNARKDRLAEAYRQVVWALICSAEFRFNY